MKRLLLSVVAAVGLLAATASAFDAEPVDKLLAAAKERAAKEHKNIFVMFDASW